MYIHSERRGCFCREKPKAKKYLKVFPIFFHVNLNSKTVLKEPSIQIVLRSLTMHPSIYLHQFTAS